MQPFAKLFEDQKYGQIVVLLDQDDEGDACIKFIAMPPGLGLCTTSLGFKDEELARSVFDQVTQENAAAGVADMWKFGSGEVDA